MMEESNVAAAPLRYAGVATLLRRPLVSDPSGVDIALIGVPYDGATENRPGARHGPREIRNMSSLTRSVHHVTRVNPYELCNIADLGDVNFSNPFDLQQCFADITDFYSKICAAGAVPLSVGGDHSISLPILRAVAAEHP
ncbi:arginase family protein, partial [candidate division KSB1 bacterium]|nr:arginase family protein [candidate division KSB1 bacterium]